MGKMEREGREKELKEKEKKMGHRRSEVLTGV